MVQQRFSCDWNTKIIIFPVIFVFALDEDATRHAENDPNFCAEQGQCAHKATVPCKRVTKHGATQKYDDFRGLVKKTLKVNKKELACVSESGN